MRSIKESKEKPGEGKTGKRKVNLMRKKDAEGGGRL